MAEATLEEYSQAYAFLGNSLLKPMSQTLAVGLDPAFWDAFPRFGSDGVDAAVRACAEYAFAAQQLADRGVDAVRECSVEFTELFVGPPAPAAAPWETMYRGENVTVGFGESTFEMRRLLRAAGLETGGDNNQYEDHMGIELLLLSVLCGRAVGSGCGDAQSDTVSPGDISAYVVEHPLAWIEQFRDKIAEARPAGYFSAIVQLAHCIMKAQVEHLSAVAKTVE